MGESNQQKNLDSWPPEKLAEAGVWVSPAFNTDGGVRCWIRRDMRPTDQVLGATCEHATYEQAMIEATRIAKERQPPRVWFIGEYENAHGKRVAWDNERRGEARFPCIITDGRVVGETPEDELEALEGVLDEVRKHCVSEGTLEQQIITLLAKLARERATNDAIAAARKRGE